MPDTRLTVARHREIERSSFQDLRTCEPVRITVPSYGHSIGAYISVRNLSTGVLPGSSTNHENIGPFGL